MNQETAVRLLLLIASVGRGTSQVDGQRALGLIAGTEGRDLSLDGVSILALATALAVQSEADDRVSDNTGLTDETMRTTRGVEYDTTGAWPTPI